MICAAYYNLLAGHLLSILAIAVVHFFYFTDLYLTRCLFCRALLVESLEEVEEETTVAMIDFLCAGAGDLRVSMTLRRSLIVINWVSLKSCRITATMADPSVAVPLPHAVEQILQRICTEQNQPPPDLSARSELASIGEEASLHLLRKISQSKIYKSLSGFIIYMARKASPPVSPVKRACSFLPNGTPSSSRHIYQQGRECTASNSPIPEHLIGDYSSMERGSRHSFSPQLVALGELEFRKAFLISSYIGRLEDVISADKIRTLKDLPMEIFESEVWNGLRQRCINVEDRQKSIDWDSGRTYLYHCHVSPDGSYTFKKFLGNVELEETVSELRQSESHTREPPLLIQCRLFNNGCAAKGTLLVNQKLPPGTIQIRPSMIKVETDLGLFDTQTVNSLEIVGTSNQPRKTCLSRFLIALLSYGGVPKGYFMDILKNALDDVQRVRFSKRAALIASLHYGAMDGFSATRMISSGIPLDEPFLQYRLSILMNEEKKGLKGGKIPISDSYYLMGTADPTGLLESDQVCIILDNGQLSGNVLVYKHPGLHFGDIHVLKATYVKAMEDYVGNAKYAIFFPTKGCRSLADEMANSDFDGDMYFVSRNPQLLECFKASEPWTWSTNTGEFCDAYSKTDVLNKKPSEFSAEDLEHKLFQLFLTTRFHPSETMGVAALSWLALMDRLLVLGDDSAEEKDSVKKNMLQLTDIYCRALHAPKSRMKVEVPKKLIAKKYPHFMEKNNSSYKSTSILGQIYDEVEAFGIENVQMNDIWCLPCFDVELPRECLALWKDRYDHYRHEMAAALHNESKDESADEVIKKYKQLLYEAADFEGSPRDTNVIFNEALAIYQVTYDHAKSQGKTSYCSFAWKVAGSALCKLYMIKQDEKSIDCAVSVLREIVS